MSAAQHPILLVEDSAEDAEATLRAFQKRGSPIRFIG